MIQLRPYQQALINSTRSALRQGKRAPLIVAPCGAGKTVLFSYMAGRASERTYIIAHRQELLDQISNTLSAFDVPHGFIAAGYPATRDRVQVCSVQTLVNRHTPPPGLVIIDEAHHATSKSYITLLAKWDQARAIGVTATPERLDGRGLGDVFDELVLGPSVADLISSGNLVPYRIYAPSRPDLTGVKRVAGDYARGELAGAVDRPTITGDAVAHYQRLAYGRRAIVFCVSIQHARHVAMAFQAAGIQSAWLEGGMAPTERKRTVQAFREGRIQILTSCDLVSEGFDLPAIEVAIMLRPTQSLALWIQQAGRALRPMEGKPEALILDHAGNVFRHGMPDADREWSLLGRPKGAGRQREQEVSVKVCQKCFAAQAPGAVRCVYCGYEFPIQHRQVDEKAGELEEVNEAARKEARAEIGRARTLAELVAIGQQRGMKHPYGWARHLMAARGRR